MQTGPFKVYVEEIENSPNHVKIVDIEGVRFEEYYNMLVNKCVYVEKSGGDNEGMLTITKKPDITNTNTHEKQILKIGDVILKSRFILIIESIEVFNTYYNTTKNLVESFDFDPYKKGSAEDTMDEITDKSANEIIDNFVKNHCEQNIPFSDDNYLCSAFVRYVYCIGYNDGYVNKKIFEQSINKN